MSLPLAKLPWWYWPVAGVPGAFCALIVRAAMNRHSARIDSDILVMFGAVYAALVLLGYLLLTLRRPPLAIPSHAVSESERPDV